MINTPKYPASHEDRHLVCQEDVEGLLRMVLDLATTHGWDTIETITAMEKVLKNLRLAHAEDPDITDDPLADSGNANDFGTFPSADGLVKAFVDEREKT